MRCLNFTKTLENSGKDLAGRLGKRLVNVVNPLPSAGLAITQTQYVTPAGAGVNMELEHAERPKRI